MKFLITGGAGFIGSALIRHLINNTNHLILNLDKMTYASNEKSLESVKGSKNYKFELCDICDFEHVKSVILDYKPDLIVHFAAESHVDRSIDSPKDFINTNIFGTFNLLEASLEYLRELKEINIKNFLFYHISTDEVFGDLEPSDPPFCESNSYKPNSPYSASKASSDHLVRSWGKTYGLPYVISNCSNNYGPFQNTEKFIPQIIIKALNGEQIPIYGAGDQVRDWLYVDDHVRAIEKVAIKGNRYNTYNIGGNSEKTNLQVANFVCELLDKLVQNKPNGINKFCELISFVDDRPGHDLRYAINATKINKELGWAPNESFETGMEKTVTWYIENYEMFSKKQLIRLGLGDKK